jgi:general nucleoside transport system permease protein
VNQRVATFVLAPLAALAFALAISSVALLLNGSSPITTFRTMLDYADSWVSLFAIINRATPYIIIGLAAAIGFRMNLFNIGIIGQYQFAALIAAWVGAELALPALIHPVAICVIAMVVGAAVAFIPAVMKTTRGINEVLSTIMLNSIVLALGAYLLRNYARQTNESGDLVARTPDIPASGLVPSLDRPVSWFFGLFGIDIPERANLYGFIVVALLVAVAFYVLVWRTRFGYDLRASGVNPSAARASGVDPKRMVIYTMLLSGALAGLAGMAFLIADPQYGSFGDQFPAQLGVTGLAVALVGRNHPGGVVAGALLYAFIERSTQPLSEIGIPVEISRIMQGAFLLGAVLGYELVRRWSQQATLRAAAARSTHTSAGTAAVGAVT